MPRSFQFKLADSEYVEAGELRLGTAALNSGLAVTATVPVRRGGCAPSLVPEYRASAGPRT